MTNLQDRVTSLRAKLIDRSEAQLDNKAQDALVAALHKADHEYTRLQGSTAVMRAAEEAGLTVQPLRESEVKSATKARTSLRRSATTCEQPDLESQKILGLASGKSVQEALNVASKLADGVIARLNAALDAERDRLRPDGITQPLPEVPGQAARIVRLKHTAYLFELDHHLDTEAVGRGDPEVILEPLAKLRRHAQQWADDYPAVMAAVEAESPEVQQFLRACATDDGASLELLTPTVLARLEKDDLLDDFRIRQR